MDQKSPSYKGLDGHDGSVAAHSPITKFIATHPTTAAFASLFFSWLLILLSIPVALDKVIGDIFSAPCTSPAAAAAGYPGCLGADHVIAILVFIIFSLVAFLCIGYSLLIFARARSPVKWVGVALCLITLFAPAVGVMVVYIRPAEVYTPVDALQRILSVYYFSGSFALLFSTVFVLFRMLTRRHSSDSFFPGSSTPILGSHRGDGSSLDHSVNIKFSDSSDYGVSTVSALFKSFILLLFFAGVFVMTGFFPAVWAGPVGGYISVWSDYAYNVDLGPLIVWKSYPDIVAYYTFIAGIILVGVLTQIFPPFRRFLHTRGLLIFHRFYRGRNNPYLPHVTFGEQFLLLAVAGLAAFWFWYFRFGFGYIPLAIAGSGDPKPLITIWARVFGHFTNLSMSFLAYPVARNSFWEAVFGVPYERALKYHRGLGSLTYILVSIHMLLWYIKFGTEGHLIQNLFTTTGLTISDGNVHFDNFTVALCQFGWIGLTFMVIIAWFRRVNWEAFRVSHYFAIIFLIIALLHAWANWFYTTGGLLLWLYDRSARSYTRATTTAELISAEHAYGVTRLVFQNPSFKAQPGQYVYLNFPEISIFQWHPFSVSSCNGSVITFHIKSMGPGTFTDQLAHHVSSFPIYKQNVALGSPSGISRTQFDVTSEDGEVSVSGPGRTLTAYLDGPYGRFADLTNRSELLLIAGGIGATPMMSVLGDLHQRFVAAQSGAPLPAALKSIRLVRLIFCTSDVHTIYAFAPLLSAIKANNPDQIFDIRLFSTQRYDYGDKGPSSFTDVTSDHIQAIASSIHHGRPDLNAICSEFRVTANHDALVAVCGPTTMIDAADNAAYVCGLDFHSETFEL